MPLHHTIDTSRKLITSIWTGVATDDDFIAGLLKYQSEIKSRPEYTNYDEILDLSGISSYILTTEGIRRLSELGARTDTRGAKTRLAIIATQTVGFGLARMYQTYRSFLPYASKDVQIFRNSFDALQWIEECQQRTNDTR